MENIIARKCRRCNQLKEPKDFRFALTDLCIKCESTRSKDEIIEWIYEIQKHLKNVDIEMIIEYMNKKKDKEIFELYSAFLDIVVFLDECETYSEDNTV